MINTWTGPKTHCGVTYGVHVSIDRTTFASSADVEIKEILTGSPGGVGIDVCGHWGGGDDTWTIIEIYPFLAGCNQATTAAHEYGHEIGFDDMYHIPTLEPLHGDAEDIMADGALVKGYHARILRQLNQ